MEVYIGLNEICEPYGTGVYATKARSITVEDVDRVTGYDKTTYGKGTIEEYGNVVKYLYNGTGTPSYSGTNGVTGTLLLDHGTLFLWYEEYQECRSASLRTTSGIITEIKSTFYFYDVNSETDLQKKAEKAYNMLFGLSDENSFLLASWVTCCNTYRVEFGFLEVRNGEISGYCEVTSNAEFFDNWSTGVRAVVQLSSDLKLTGSSSSGWSIV